MQIPRSWAVAVVVVVLGVATWWAWGLWRETLDREPVRPLPAPTPWLGDPVGQVLLDDPVVVAEAEPGGLSGELGDAQPIETMGQGGGATTSDAAVPEGMQPVCGGDPLPARQRRQPQWPSPDEVPGLADGLRRIAAQLAAGDVRSQAAGLIVSYEAFKSERRLPRGCPRGDNACLQTQREARAQDRIGMAALAQALSALAAGSNAWSVWSLAASYCQSAGDRGAACQDLNWRQWAAQEPGNGWPWLMLAEAAVRVGDGAGVDEALYQVTQSRRIDSHHEALAAVLMDPLFDPNNGLPAITATYALADAILRVRTPWGAVNTYCRKPQLADANRRMVCETLANVLASSGDASASVVLGLSIGRQLGWSSERQSATLQQLREGQRQRRELARSARQQPLGCKAATSVREWLLQRAGEDPAAAGLVGAQPR